MVSYEIFFWLYHFKNLRVNNVKRHVNEVGYHVHVGLRTPASSVIVEALLLGKAQ